jgi:hypothetical protein
VKSLPIHGEHLLMAVILKQNSNSRAKSKDERAKIRVRKRRAKLVWVMPSESNFTEGKDNSSRRTILFLFALCSFLYNKLKIYEQI